MKSSSNKITRTQVLTIVLIIAYVYVNKWSKILSEGSGAIIRVDLVMIYPVLCALIIVSLIQVFKHKKEQIKDNN